jgi:putative transposase
MIVRKSFQFRLKPTKKQARLLDMQLDECRWLYNELLAQRKLAYEDLEISLTKYQQLMFLPVLKEERTSLNSVYSQVLQNVVDRLDKAFQGFFRRCKAGQEPGFPRFRGMHRYSSFCYPQSGFTVIDSQLKLAKIGSIRINKHRFFEGEIKTCTLRKLPGGQWNVSFSCEVTSQPLLPNEKAVGIDVGITHFAVLSNGEEIDNPRFFQKEEKALAKAQKKLAKETKGTKERKSRGKIVSKIHERIRNRRNDFCHKQSKKIVDQYQYICIEDLNIKKMVEGSHFAKNITDVSWNQFRQFLTYKAEEAGRKLGLVNPAYTTQTCSQCGHIEAKQLSDRKHCCMNCGYTTSRDFNASQNILALGLDGLGVIPRSPYLRSIGLQARE